MSRIQMLDSATINKIAAGEVVERPVSVIKELTENALDAGATAITVEIRDGGISYLRVTDNGAGIPADQVKTAFLRHSTSKITAVEDLLTNLTLGFRGEALASIAAVARVEILTKTEEALTGIRYVIEGGRELIYEEAACPTGTTLRVENLFFNVPARKKFLKKPAAEAGAITDYMQRLILGHPDVSFRYLNGKASPSLISGGKGDLASCIFAVYGRETLDKMLPIELSSEGIEIRGYISRPQLTRANRSYQSLYINGRWVRSPLVEKVLDEVYKDYIVPGTYPAAVLQVTMDPGALDVNVHPTKMEVRFTDEELIRRVLRQAVEQSLQAQSLVSHVGEIHQPIAEEKAKEKEILTPVVAEKTSDTAGISKPVSFSMPIYIEEIPKVTVPEKKEESQTVVVEKSVTPAYPKGQQIAVYEEKYEAPVLEVREEVRTFGQKNPEVEQLRLIGQVFATYWLAEGNGLLYIMDQHAAHERVMYDRLRKMLREGTLDSQILLEPSVFPANPRDVASLEEWRPLFEKLGFEVEAFGEDAVVVRCVPFIFNGPMSAEDFAVLLDLLHDGNTDAGRDLLLDKMAMMSCKAAVKGNSLMTEKEARRLLDDLFASENPYNCPHGRPTIISMSQYDMEKKFKRT